VGVIVSTPLIVLSAVLVSYLIGSVPAASWLARSRGVDIRKVGSGNSGATNVLRSLGKGPAFMVAAFDILKGALAVWLARALHLPPEWVGLCGVAAVIGHNFSPFLGFRGGKGVATSFGTITVLDPVAGAGAFVLGVAAMWLTRFVSAGSILGALTAGIVVVALGRPVWLTLVVLFLAALLIWQHRSNIGRLTAGKESRLGDKVR
jgi:glycerol-3-phosphate acyltransferase PlsY